MILIIRARPISRGTGSGQLLISPTPISFLSGVDPETGTIIETGHPLKGTRITGKVLAFAYGKGSTVGSYILYALGRNGNGPAAIINTEAEPIVAVGAIIGNIPMVDRPEIPLEQLKDGTRVSVNGESGEIQYEGEIIS